MVKNTCCAVAAHTLEHFQLILQNLWFMEMDARV